LFLQHELQFCKEAVQHDQYQQPSSTSYVWTWPVAHMTTMLLNEDDGKGTSAQQRSEAAFCM